MHVCAYVRVRMCVCVMCMPQVVVSFNRQMFASPKPAEFARVANLVVEAGSTEGWLAYTGVLRSGVYWIPHVMEPERRSKYFTLVGSDSDNKAFVPALPWMHVNPDELTHSWLLSSSALPWDRSSGPNKAAERMRTVSWWSRELPAVVMWPAKNTGMVLLEGCGLDVAVSVIENLCVGRSAHGSSSSGGGSASDAAAATSTTVPTTGWRSVLTAPEQLVPVMGSLFNAITHGLRANQMDVPEGGLVARMLRCLPAIATVLGMPGANRLPPSLYNASLSSLVRKMLSAVDVFRPECAHALCELCHLVGVSEVVIAIQGATWLEHSQLLHLDSVMAAALRAVAAADGSGSGAATATGTPAGAASGGTSTGAAAAAASSRDAPYVATGAAGAGAGAAAGTAAPSGTASSSVHATDAGGGNGGGGGGGGGNGGGGGADAGVVASARTRSSARASAARQSRKTRASGARRSGSRHVKSAVTPSGADESGDGSGDQDDTFDDEDDSELADEPGDEPGDDGAGAGLMGGESDSEGGSVQVRGPAPRRFAGELLLDGVPLPPCPSILSFVIKLSHIAFPNSLSSEEGRCCDECRSSDAQPATWSPSAFVGRGPQPPTASEADIWVLAGCAVRPVLLSPAAQTPLAACAQQLLDTVVGEAFATNVASVDAKANSACAHTNALDHADCVVLAETWARLSHHQNLRWVLRSYIGPELAPALHYFASHPSVTKLSSQGNTVGGMVMTKGVGWEMVQSLVVSALRQPQVDDWNGICQLLLGACVVFGCCGARCSSHPPLRPRPLTLAACPRYSFCPAWGAAGERAAPLHLPLPPPVCGRVGARAWALLRLQAAAAVPVCLTRRHLRVVSVPVHRRQRSAVQLCRPRSLHAHLPLWCCHYRAHRCPVPAQCQAHALPRVRCRLRRCGGGGG